MPRSVQFCDSQQYITLFRCLHYACEAYAVLTVTSSVRFCCIYNMLLHDPALDYVILHWILHWTNMCSKYDCGTSVTLIVRLLCLCYESDAFPMREKT